MTGAKSDFSGCSTGRWWWGEVSAALWISWRAPASFWRSSECFWAVELGCGGLRWKIAARLISDRNWVQVFVVEGWVCSGGEG